MEKNLDLIVVGAGAAGLTAGIYLKRSNLKSLVFEKSAPGGILLNIHQIDNYPGVPKVSGPDLAVNMFTQANELGVEIAYEEVKKIEKEGEDFVVYANDVYRAKTVIVASGMASSKARVTGEEAFLGKGVSYCASCDGAFFKGKDVALYGHNDRVAEEAIYLSGLANHVYILAPKETEFEEGHAETLSCLENVELIPMATLKEIQGSDHVEHLVYEQNGETKTLDVSGIFPLREGAGSSTFLYALGVEENRGFLVADKEGKTNVPGLFVAGDATDKKLRQVANAVGEAASASSAAIAYVRSLKKR